MTWFWLNIPVSLLVFCAVTGIPLWMVIKHPDTGPVTPGMGPGIPAAAAVIVIPAQVRRVDPLPVKARASR